ncbi:amidohydrolase family protein [Candidatus Woesearchaeota archaeon]|jgi:predicted TIM-barrel fold metal-dependent hydrolase|nr:amidohydrolase family protein [Candidatus Woesearchaeota archaeon]MBT3438924.1 amidohydrolase family protein [Candidatus Woesearchaeota archaeon]MBT4058190.1 amidohydrolase family protein [Candidatus Woesearchaeota archaeon]MBT4206845.1 amidohydrolase family protein [Candidatus Woesearchaeota archaeon]MBT4731019.1 amidohydrolase family protein [Candidatus Woesearchaeota archaeon]
MIIDSHTHLGFEDMYQKQNPRELIKLMDRAGIDKSVIFPFGPVFSKNQSYQSENIKISKCSNNPRFITFGRVNQLAPDSLEEVERIKDLDFKGIKIHTDAAPLNTYRDLVKKLNEYCLPIMIHAGNNENSNVENLKHLEYEGNIIIGHGGKDNISKAIELVNSRDNFYIETSLLSLSRTKRLVRQVKDKSKILFGSDAPYDLPELEVKKIMHACDHDRKLVRDILGKNLEKIL